MPRAARPWFRAYSSSLDNHKLQSLPPELFKTYFNLLCVASENTPRGTLPPLDTLAFRLRQDEETTARHLHELRERKFIDGSNQIHDWEDWQYESDTRETPGRSAADAKHSWSADRGGSAAKRRRNDGDNATVARHRTDTDTEQKQSRTETEERREDARAREPPSHPFAFAYAENFMRLHQRRVPHAQHGEALALEKEFGSDACFTVARELDWSKPPAYMRPRLEERRAAPRASPSAPQRLSELYKQPERTAL